MEGTVYVNGEFVPAAEAKVSAFDRGFIFGDGVYEVVPVVGGRLVDRRYFLERLARSLDETGIARPCSDREFLALMTGLVERDRLREGAVYLQVTRGAAKRDFPFPADTPPTVVAFAVEMDLMDSPAAAAGIRVVTTPDLRWKRRDIKSVSLLAQCLAKQDAVARGADEGWMVEDGMVTEGVSSTAWIVRDGAAVTRPLSNEVLPGIRRRTLLELAEAAGVAVELRPFTVAEAQAADEAFISSASTIVLGVVSIDGKRVGDGAPGPVTMRLRGLYRDRMLAEAGGS